MVGHFLGFSNHSGLIRLTKGQQLQVTELIGIPYLLYMTHRADFVFIFRICPQKNRARCGGLGAFSILRIKNMLQIWVIIVICDSREASHD
jgi:hypothetical protein